MCQRSCERVIQYTSEVGRTAAGRFLMVLFAASCGSHDKRDQNSLRREKIIRIVELNEKVVFLTLYSNEQVFIQNSIQHTLVDKQIFHFCSESQKLVPLVPILLILFLNIIIPYSTTTKKWINFKQTPKLRNVNTVYSVSLLLKLAITGNIHSPLLIFLRIAYMRFIAQ